MSAHDDKWARALVERVNVMYRNARRSATGERLADHPHTPWCDVIGCRPAPSTPSASEKGDTRGTDPE